MPCGPEYFPNCLWGNRNRIDNQCPSFAQLIHIQVWKGFREKFQTFLGNSQFIALVSTYVCTHCPGHGGHLRLRQSCFTPCGPEYFPNCQRLTVSPSLHQDTLRQYVK